MRRHNKVTQTVVNLMTDPNPTFVSLVGHGANQTPFKVVKSIEIMKTEVQRFVFSKEKFPTSEGVVAHLESKGFLEAEPVEGDTEWTVVHKEADLFTGDLQTVASETGVTQFVGHLKEEAAPAPAPEQKSTPTAPAETPVVQPVAKSLLQVELEGSKGQEKTQKFYGWAAEYTGAETLEEAIKDGIEADGGLPIGYDDLTCAFRQVVKNIFKSGDLAALDAEANGYVSKLKVLASLNTLASKSTNSEVAQKVAKSILPAEDKNPSEAPAPAPAPAQKQPETPPVEAPAVVTPTPEPAPAPETPPAAPTVDEIVAKAVAAVSVENQKVVKSLEDRIKLLEQPTRKGASVDQVPGNVPAGGTTTLPAQAPVVATRTRGWDNGSGV